MSRVGIVAQCQSKAWFKNRHMADIAINRMRKREQATNRGALRAYFCPICAGYHVGRRRP